MCVSGKEIPEIGLGGGGASHRKDGCSRAEANSCQLNSGVMRKGEREEKRRKVGTTLRPQLEERKLAQRADM